MSKRIDKNEMKKETTPIKEEDIEEEFDDGQTENSKRTGYLGSAGGTFLIEEARNYDS